jgi:DNA polymerase-3 subunit delta
VDVLVVEQAIDKRTSWYKFLQKNSDFRVLEPIDEFSLKKWVRLRVEERGVTIDEPAVTLLVRSGGLDQLRISTEIDKLCDYTNKITAETVAELVEPTFEDTVFSLLEALFRGDGKTSYRLLYELKSRKTDSFEVISMIGWQVSILMTIVANRSMSVDELSKSSKIHPYVLQKNMSLARRLSIQSAKQLLEYVVQAELSIKKDSEKPERALDVLMAQILVAVDE